MSKSSKRTERFPLGIHKATGQYCKRCRGKVFYFGRDKEHAHARYLREWKYILQGIPVPADGESF